jgi:hypothetical protein
VASPEQDDNRLNNLATRLRALAQGRDTLDVAQFQFVGLDEIRVVYGPRWPENQERILGTAEGFLRRRTDSQDLLIRVDGGFLLIFGEAVGEEAVASAGRLSHGLNEFFLGELREQPAPRMSATSHTAPVAKLAATFADVEFVDHVPQPPPEPAAGTEAGGIPNVDWRYQPVWDVRRETLTSWYIAPFAKGTSNRLPGYQFECDALPSTQSAAIDEASLMISEKALASLIPSGRQMLIGASIHVSSLAHQASRARIMAVIDRLDRRFFRYRLLKIAGIAPGFPRLYLNEVVGLLKAKAPNVVLGAAWDEPDMAGIVQSGPAAVGVTLTKSVLGPAAPVPLAKLMQKLGADIQTAHAARIRYFVEGQIERDLAAKLAAISVDNISSPRIWQPTVLPEGMLKWPSSRLAA